MNSLNEEFNYFMILRKKDERKMKFNKRIKIQFKKMIDNMI